MRSSPERLPFATAARVLGALVGRSPATEPLNVLVVLADDQGRGDLGVHGNGFRQPQGQGDRRIVVIVFGEARSRVVATAVISRRDRELTGVVHI